ncbi:MAG: hypothetical protein HY660_03655 [Armatimonadetes bacterium]|nr:hypothetical protein [Armatimonadota bacterium]
MGDLHQLLPEELKKGLTPAEVKLLQAMPKGQIVDLRSGDEQQDDPANAEHWGEDRSIRAALFCWLCVDPPAEPIHPKGIQIQGARIEGPLDFEGARVLHPLTIIDSAVRGTLIFRHAFTRLISLFRSHTGPILADAVTTEGSVLLRKVHAAGQVRLVGARIGGQLSCWGSAFENAEGCALHADGISVSGDVVLNQVHAKGEVRLLGATVGGQLACRGGRFEHPRGNALAADGITVKGDVVLDGGFHARGEVRLLGAKIGGQLVCSGGRFINCRGDAFTADGIKVEGDVFLDDGFRARGEVRLLGADLGGDLNCGRGRFKNPQGNCLSVSGVTVKRAIFLTKQFCATGEVVLSGADVGAQLACIDGRFENPEGVVLRAENMSVRGALILRRVRFNGILDLIDTRVRQLADSHESWPEVGRLRLEGLEYGAFSGDDTPTSGKERLVWLRRQPPKPFRPQPYEHLAKVLRQMGRESDAREVLIAKQEDLIRHGELGFWSKWGKRTLGWTLDYGYRPWKVLWWILPLIVVGSLVFGSAERNGLMAPSSIGVLMSDSYRQTRALPRDYPAFQAVVYSLDTFLPIINFHQDAYWLATTDKPYGWIVRLYLWLHIALGWLFSTLAVAGITGLVRKE